MDVYLAWWFMRFFDKLSKNALTDQCNYEEEASDEVDIIEKRIG